MAFQLAFAIFSAIVIIAAWRVVTSENMMRAALALVIVLAGLAPLFIMLAAELVATVQVLVYVGAVIILFLFGIMLTRSPATTRVVTKAETDSFDYRHRWPGFLIAAGLFVALWIAIREAFGGEEVAPKQVSRTADVGISLLRDQVIAFEAISVLLLAALIGAIVLARRD